MESMSGGLIFAKHSFGVSENERITISPFLRNIVRIVPRLDIEGKEHTDLYIYTIDKNTGNDNNNVSFICHKEYFDYPRFIFSHDGKGLLISVDNSLYNFRIYEKNVNEVNAVKLSELCKTSKVFKTDFVPQDVQPVQLKDNSITICIDNHWLVAFQCHPDLGILLNYCLAITNSVLYLQNSKDKVHCLTNCGKIFSYYISDGLLSSIFDLYSVLPNTLHLEKFTLNMSNHQIAVYDNSKTVYILHVPLTGQHEYLEGTSQYKSRSESIQSNSHSATIASISRISATSHLPSWASYLEKLSIRNRIEHNANETPQSQSFICINDLPENTVVKTIQFYSYGSLGVWCVPQNGSGDSFYRVYDSSSGRLEMSETLDSTISVIPLNCPGISLDIFSGPGLLSLPLVSTSKEILVNKLLNCVGSDCVSWLLELDKSLSQSMRPLFLLRDGLKDSQLHLVKLSLNLHLQELKRELTMGKRSDPMDSIAMTKTVMDHMITVVKDPTTKESFNHKILMEALTYANKILSLLQSKKEDTEHLNDLKVEILKRVVHLRSGLRKQQQLPVEDCISISQWSTWEVLSDKEIVKENVKNLPLVHCFLILRKHWTPNDIIGERFKRIVVSVAIDFLQKEYLQEAQDFLIQTGYDPSAELLMICKTTFNRSLRDYLMTTITEEEYVEAWKFIKIMESILDRYTIPNPFIDYPQGPDAKLTLSNIMSYSSELKTQILTDLYFNTQDATLLKYLEREVCWDYLLSYNCVEALRTWIDCSVVKVEPKESSPWPVSLFLQWPITQDMVDHVLEVDVADYTKETLLNQLARSGIFSSSEKRCPQTVMTRLAYCKLLLQYKDILEKPTATLLYKHLERMLLKYAIEHDLLDLVVMALPPTLVVEENEERQSWFSLWKTFCEVSTDWDNESVTKLLTQTSDYLAQGDVSAYLKKHPYVAIATGLLKKKEISRVYAYFSPLIAAMTAAEPLPKDITVYSLLAGTIPFYTDNLFQFQPDQNRTHKETVLQMPDFTNEELSKKYGHNQSLRFTDRLKQGRPCQAVIHLFDKNGRISAQIKKHACNAAHGLALYHVMDPIVSTSCIAFTEMLGKDSNLLRTHLECALIMQKNKDYDNDLKSQLYKMVVNQVGIVEEVLRAVELTLEAEWKNEVNTILCLRQNQLPVRLAVLHGLPPSYMILKYAAESNNWLLFVLAAQIFQYPLQKVQEMVAEFTCHKLQEHLYYALAIEPIQQCDMSSIATGGLDINQVKTGPNNCHLQCKYELFSNIAQCNNNAEEMLNMSRKVGNPVLALLATCLKPKSVISPFCTWLLTSIQVPLKLNEPWTPNKVLEILELTVQLGHIGILAQAFSIFIPNNPLKIFSTFLVHTVIEKKFQSGTLTLKAFKAACMNLPDKITGRIIGFMKNKNWISNAALRMASTALVYCFKSSYHQNRFLKVLVDSQFSQHLSVAGPNYSLFLRLSNCLAHTDLTLDYNELCLQDNRSQLMQTLQLLIERKDFQTAFRFASTAGLSLGPVHIADWSVRAKTEEAQEPGFWSRCQTALHQALVEPHLAAEFLRKQAALQTTPQDRFVVLKCALAWIKKIPAEDEYLKQENNIYLDLYLTALEQGFNLQMVTEGMTFTPLRHLTSDLERKGRLPQEVPKLSQEQHYKLDSLIHRLLEVGDIMTVVSLQDVFEHVNQDYELVVACMSLAEGKSFHELPEMIQDLLNIDSNTSLSNKPKLPASSPSKKKSTVIDIEVQQKVLSYLYALQAHQTCPTPMFRNIINAYKVASALGLDYKAVITHPEPLSLLHVEDDFELAGYVFTLAALTKTELTQYLAEQLISVIHAGPVDDSYILWGCDLDTQFLRLLNLEGTIPLMLGSLLLSSVPRLDSKTINLREDYQGCWTRGVCGEQIYLGSYCSSRKQVHLLKDWTFKDYKIKPPMNSFKSWQCTIVQKNYTAVELLIRSHDCFTKACNMEGISSILTMSGDLVNLLLDCCQWALMVRLLTGVGRYTEMNYIFQILKDRDQFEFLLGKGLDKYPGLMSAMLDFVRYDKPRYMLVAVHFCMYSELAVLFKDEAKNELGKLEKGQDGYLMNNEHNKRCLQAAMNKYADATNHYIQANKQKQGVVCIQQAELVALQLSLMATSSSSHNVHCLINLSSDQVTALIVSILSYEEACIVSAAYNISVEWSASLYYHCIVQGETSYLNSWCQHNQFTMTIVQDVARRFQNSKTINASTETNMKWFLSSVNQVDIKYRICSQLGFKDLLQTILSGPDLAYLKDTVWQTGFKYPGFHS